MFRKLIPWILYLSFVISAISLNWKQGLLIPNEHPLAYGKYICWLAFFAFTAYSIYCSRKENLFKTLRKMAGFHWGRQIGIDLYIGVSIFLFLIYLHEKSMLVVLLWMLPTLLYANLSTLLYFALHYDSIIAVFGK